MGWAACRVDKQVNHDDLNVNDAAVGKNCEHSEGGCENGLHREKPAEPAGAESPAPHGRSALIKQTARINTEYESCCQGIHVFESLDILDVILPDLLTTLFSV